MMTWLNSWLWPIKTGVTIVDYWTLSHLAFWFWIGSSIAGMSFSRFWLMLSCVGVAFAWEFIERFAERAWPQFWLSPEGWINSWASDPLTCVIAVLVAWYGYDHWRP